MKNVWLDCDPGHDDVMAILMAAFHPDLKLIGISTVAGNQSVVKTCFNARALLSYVGMNDLEVLCGQSSALLSPMPFCAEIHGESGLDGPDGNALFPLVSGPAEEKFWLPVMREKILMAAMECGEQVWLVCTGSLTNAALLLTLHPELKPFLRISLMGGALGIGNTGSVAEFNIENDPEAARIVFESGVPVCMVPLELTHQVLVDETVLNSIGDGSEFRRKILDLLLFFRNSYRDVFGFEHPPLHDPLAVFYVLQPALFKTKAMYVAIECGSALSRGQTVCDYYGRSGFSANAEVALEVDVQAFWSEMLVCLNRAEQSREHMLRL
jgi:purine nucleosidase/pyrimidine-specific ribonucleoside hydrolase